MAQAQDSSRPGSPLSLLNYLRTEFKIAFAAGYHALGAGYHAIAAFVSLGDPVSRRSPGKAQSLPRSRRRRAPIASRPGSGKVRGTRLDFMIALRP
jgi:hypothetical protein